MRERGRRKLDLNLCLLAWESAARWSWTA